MVTRLHNTVVAARRIAPPRSPAQAVLPAAFITAVAPVPAVD